MTEIPELTLEEAREFLVTDKNKLDEACENQAMLFSDIADRYAKVKGQRDFLKEERDAVYSTVYFEIKDKAEVDKVKITEACIKNAATINTNYRDACKKYIEYCQLEEEWRGKKDSMMQRVSMVKELCQLYISQYYIKEFIAKTEV
jgi:hypothetical protein